MSATALTVTAMFEHGVLRPDQPLPLAPRQKVTLTLQLPARTHEWPEDMAIEQNIQQDIIEQRALAEVIELDRPIPVDISRQRTLVLIDPDAEVLAPTD